MSQLPAAIGSLVRVKKFSFRKGQSYFFNEKLFLSFKTHSVLLTFIKISMPIA
jgi:hypothetical protein